MMILLADDVATLHLVSVSDKNPFVFMIISFVVSPAHKDLHTQSEQAVAVRAKHQELGCRNAGGCKMQTSCKHCPTGH